MPNWLLTLLLKYSISLLILYNFPISLWKRNVKILIILNSSNFPFSFIYFLLHVFLKHCLLLGAYIFICSWSFDSYHYDMFLFISSDAISLEVHFVWHSHRTLALFCLVFLCCKFFYSFTFILCVSLYFKGVSVSPK